MEKPQSDKSHFDISLTTIPEDTDYDSEENSYKESGDELDITTLDLDSNRPVRYFHSTE